MFVAFKVDTVTDAHLAAASCATVLCILHGGIKCRPSLGRSCYGSRTLVYHPLKHRRLLFTSPWLILVSSLSSNQQLLIVSTGNVLEHCVDQAPDELANVSLLKSGYLGCSPLQPTLAISLSCLELYHQIRRRKPSFSVQGMVKVLCALHNVSVQCLSQQLLTLNSVLIFSHYVTSSRSHSMHILPLCER